MDASRVAPGVPTPDSDDTLPVVTLTMRRDSAGAHTIECASPTLRPFAPSPVAIDTAALGGVEVDAAAYGELLGRAVFVTPGAGDTFEEIRTALLHAVGGFRVRMRLDDAETAALRWERLTVPWGDGTWRPLATTARTPLSRVAFYQQSLAPVEPIHGRHVRVLVIIASPTGLPPGMGPIDEPERAAVRDAIRAIGDDAVALTVLESGTATPPTIAAVRDAIARAPDIVHVLCHGAMTPAGGVLFLEKEDGRATPFAALEIASALESAQPHPRLVVLSACESATPASVSGTSAVGPAIVARSADAVLAMHGPLTVATAAQFTRTFYARLYAHGQVDLATAEARAAVVDAWDWSTPVLFMRHDHGRIIDFDVGNFGAGIGRHTSAVATPIAELPRRAAQADAPHAVIQAMTDLQGELGKSHEFLVTLGDAFRRTGNDASTFAQQFDAFRLDFERAYDAQTWVQQQTSCRVVRECWQVARPFVQAALAPDTFSALDQEMQYLGNADADTIHFMRRVLDEMKDEVDAIDTRIAAGDIAGAMARKRAFERRLSDSFRRSRAFLQQIESHVGRATAA
ncbi:MAG: CHAT domain-containing protein [Gemmatimonadaceae bacterium]|nr:CHAT domain-containing protein [Gemmatimonadaceae bacterium]